MTDLNDEDRVEQAKRRKEEREEMERKVRLQAAKEILQQDLPRKRPAEFCMSEIRELPNPERLGKDPWFRNRLIRDGIYQAIYAHMKMDPAVYIMGEGSHMKVHFDAPYIERDFPERVITLPISEDANTNFAVGMALADSKPIVDVITADFLYRTMDSICNTVAKTNFVSNPKTIVIRAEFLTAGPTTGQRPESLFTHIPGLNVVIPSNPFDARGLMDTALRTREATIFFEDRMIPDQTTFQGDMLSQTDGQDIPAYGIPFGRAKVKVSDPGAKVTVVSYALTLRMLQCFGDFGMELIDLRTIYPVDYETISRSVEQTGALIIVEPDVMYAGVGAEIAATITEMCHESLRHPVKRFGAPRTTIPASRNLHDLMLPSITEIADAVEELSK
jgi:pyruvate dehydrogenase E1 component beta subunit